MIMAKNTAPAPISKAKATAPAALGPLVTAPDLHGSGPAVEAAVASLFGLAADANETAETVENTVSEPENEVQTSKEVPGTVESGAEVASEGENSSLEAPAGEKPSEFERLRAIALEKARAREQKGVETAKNRDLEARLAQIEAQAAQDRQAAKAFRDLQALSKSDPIAAIEALGHDPVAFLQSGHRQAIDRQGHKQAQTVEQLQAEIEALKAKLEEVPQTIEQRERVAVNTKARREFVALTEDGESYPLLATEPPESRLLLAQEMANLLMEAEEDVTHERVAKLAEARLESEYAKKEAARRRKTGESPSEDAAHTGGRAAPTGRSAGGRASPKTISNSLVAEPPAAREKTPQERERAATAIAGRLFGLT